MAASIKPVAKVVYICDDVVADPVSGKVSLLNLWDTIRVPRGAGFPYTLGRVCVFVWWRNGLGRVRSWVDIVQAAKGDTIRRTGDCWLDFPDRNVSHFTRYRIEKCIFPSPGEYIVELYCDHGFVDDQVIQVLPPGD